VLAKTSSRTLVMVKVAIWVACWWSARAILVSSTNTKKRCGVVRDISWYTLIWWWCCWFECFILIAAISFLNIVSFTWYYILPQILLHWRTSSKHVWNWSIRLASPSCNHFDLNPLLIHFSNLHTQLLFFH
jgi:hypothetical protein